MTKYGITGYSGHVGQELLKYPDMVPLAGDVRNIEDIDLAVRNTKVDVIIHLASISDVDVCEKKENQKLVDATNVRGTFHVAEVADKYNCGMVILSSSHIFDGKWGNYTEKSRPNPQNYYGLTKLAAEGFREIFPFMKVVRTSYLFDHERVFRHLYPLRAGESIECPTFIERSFMYLPHFAEAFYWYLINYDRMPKVLNIAGTLEVSWYDFLSDMVGVYKLNQEKVCPRDSEIDVIDMAPRPYRAGLNVSLSKKLEMPQYGYLEGLQEMRDISR